jgi:hypothetical protein
MNSHAAGPFHHQPSAGLIAPGHRAFSTIEDIASMTLMTASGRTSSSASVENTDFFNCAN